MGIAIFGLKAENCTFRLPPSSNYPLLQIHIDSLQNRIFWVPSQVSAVDSNGLSAFVGGWGCPKYLPLDIAYVIDNTPSMRAQDTTGIRFELVKKLLFSQTRDYRFTTFSLLLVEDSLSVFWEAEDLSTISNNRNHRSDEIRQFLDKMQDSVFSASYHQPSIEILLNALDSAQLYLSRGVSDSRYHTGGNIVLVTNGDFSDIPVDISTLDSSYVRDSAAIHAVRINPDATSPITQYISLKGNGVDCTARNADEAVEMISAVIDFDSHGDAFIATQPISLSVSIDPSPQETQTFYTEDVNGNPYVGFGGVFDSPLALGHDTTEITWVLAVGNSCAPDFRDTITTSFSIVRDWDGSHSDVYDEDAFDCAVGAEENHVSRKNGNALEESLLVLPDGWIDFNPPLKKGDILILSDLRGRRLPLNFHSATGRVRIPSTATPGSYIIRRTTEQGENSYRLVIPK